MKPENKIMSNLFLGIAGTLILSLILSFILLMCISPCLAAYNFEGVGEGGDQDTLRDIASGTVKGGLYVDAGEAKGLDTTPYTEEFNVPGTSVKWARVYVGVWGGTEAKTGTLDLTVNGKEFDTVDLEGSSDSGDVEDEPTVYCSGHGVYWVAYDMGTNISTGPVKVEAETDGTIDGRVYGIVLVAVYEDEGGDQVKYWVEEGNLNLHGIGWSGSLATTHDDGYAEFSGRVDVDKYNTANLIVTYLCGTPGLDDSLYFNDEQLSDGDNENDIANSANYFDFKYFDVLDLLEKNDNELHFQRDDEDYVHPVLATLCLGTAEEGSSDLTVSGVNVPTLYAGQDNTITAKIKNIGPEPSYGFQAALYANDDIVSTASVSSLQSDATKTIKFNWKPAFGGEAALKVYVDYMDNKDELNEINNWNMPFLANIIDLTPPEIEIDTPEDGSLVDAGYLTVSGTVEDTDQNLAIDVNGQKAMVSGKSWSAQVPVYSGFNKIIVNATDGANNTGREFIVVNVKSGSTFKEIYSLKNETGSSNQTYPASQQEKNETEVKNNKVGLPAYYVYLGLFSATAFQRLRNRRKLP